jgi:ribosomal protein S3
LREEGEMDKHRLSVDIVAALVVHTAHGAVGLAVAVETGESQSRGREEEREKDEPLDLALTALRVESE